MITPEQALKLKRDSFLKEVNMPLVEKINNQLDALLADNPRIITHVFEDKNEEMNNETLFYICHQYQEGGWTVDYRQSKDGSGVKFIICEPEKNTVTINWKRRTYLE